MMKTYAERECYWNENDDCILDPKAPDANHPHQQAPNDIRLRLRRADSVKMLRVCIQPFPTDKPPGNKMQINLNIVGGCMRFVWRNVYPGD